MTLRFSEYSQLVLGSRGESWYMGVIHGRGNIEAREMNRVSVVFRVILYVLAKADSLFQAAGDRYFSLVNLLDMQEWPVALGYLSLRVFSH